MTMKKKIAKWMAIALSISTVFCMTSCFNGDGSSATGGSSQGSTQGSTDGSSQGSSGSSTGSESVLPETIGQEGYYTLTQKTVAGVDITDSFLCNTIYLANGEAELYSVDFEGAETQTGTYTVSGGTVSIVIGIKTYNYTYDMATGSMTYSGKISKQQVVMTYTYDSTYQKGTVNSGVSFQGATELFGDDLSKNFYNYCPSVMMEGSDTMHIWYCANEISSNVTDYVAYRKGTLNDSGKWTFGERQLVLGPGASGTWDSRHTCDPSVVKGVFGWNGETYSYLMSYLGCKTSDCTKNEVGIAVAKNPEGPYVKVDTINPIANFYTADDYKSNGWGYGQPSVISVDKQGKILLFYTVGSGETYVRVEEWDLSNLAAPQKLRTKAVSKMGTTGGFNNADFAYDPGLQRLYCIKEDTPYPTDGGVNWISGSNTVCYVDLGDAGLETLFGEYMWSVLGTVNKTATGFDRNHNSGLMTDEYGRLLNSFKIPVVYTMSDLASAYPGWNGGGQWPALHTYRLHGYVFDTK